MISRMYQLLPAKYKNIIFFVRSETVDQLGQKRIIHDYPNTQARYLEPQGTVTPPFKLEIFFSSDRWIEEYEAFKRAIEDPLPGRLILPTFGVFENMVALPARAESRQEAIGEIPVSVTFSATVERPAPTEAATSEQDVSSQAQTTRVEIQGAFANV
jgi:prophage DNA circulation protein